MDALEQMREAFRPEALDLLIELDSALLSLEAEPEDTALLHRVFRAIHTIKGSGGMAGFAHLARFAHGVEEAFDLAREGRLAVTPELIDCALKACDIVRLILEGNDDGEEVEGEEAVSCAFQLLLPAHDIPRQEADELQRPAAVARTAYKIVFKPHREMFYSGADPVTLLDDLRELGNAYITAHADRVPRLSSFEAEHCYLWWEILLVTDLEEAAVREVFVFVEDECELRLERSEHHQAVAVLGSVPPDAYDLFVAECQEHLQSMERDALALEAGSASNDELNSLFRSVHSIKGNAGLLIGEVKGDALGPGHSLQLLRLIAHALESRLDPFRETTAGVPADMIQLALETGDAMRGLLGNLTHAGGSASALPELLARLGLPVLEKPEASEAPLTAGRTEAFLNTASQCVEMIEGCWQRLKGDGEVPLPVFETYRRGLKNLSSAARYESRAELEEPVALQLQILETAMRGGAVLGEAERAALGNAFQSVRAILGGTSPEASSDGPAKVSLERTGTSASPSTVRIDQNKLDRLMRVVGELLVARGAFPLLVQRIQDGDAGSGFTKDLKEAGSNISRIADDLQSSVMSIRMLPVKTVFQRFPRLVRDLARSLGKEVRLDMQGEGIELDKTILEQIGDPLVHVIRNAVDHGLEPPEERLAQGKEASGLLTLRAAHEAGGVSLEISDDGRGLNSATLKRKAVTKGLLTPEAAAAMNDEAANDLVFLPGLSTATQITDVSGRGVGMDVVRSNIRNLQGSIEIRSKPGRGTTFLIRLPTSVMVSKGILLEAGAQEYILPLSNIRDMVKLRPEAAHRYRGLTLAQVRGTIYSIFSLAEMLGLVPARTPELSIAIVEAGDKRYGLIVDKFLTQVEVLIKPLAGGLEHCKEFQGAAIMGDGRVVLVLNALECHALGASVTGICPTLQ
jgi:two-component system chemotaxis sensor kinase CheA